MVAKNTDRQGRVVRCPNYPLRVGDALTIHSCQVHGLIDGYPHFALPGRYIITHTDESWVWMMKLGTNARFECEAYALRAIIGPWSNYTTGKSS